MINWLLGGLIIGFTLYTIVKMIRKISRGENSCSGCGGSCCKEGKTCKDSSL
ncbi:MAG: hypothetical protein H6Q63_697 [Firmicutes bacterium]|nr:hypothetical protein [Bacillota bacterium]